MVMNFTLERQEEQIFITKNHKDDSGNVIQVKEEYLLLEADGGVTAAYSNKMQEGTTLVNGLPSKVQGLGGIEIWLLSQCLWKKNEDGTLSQVSENKIKKWSYPKVTSPLIEKLKEMSGLEEEETIEKLEFEIKKLENKIQVLREKEELEKNF